jgi:hypothetical protein
MQHKHSRLFTNLIASLFISAFFAACTNIYYVGQTTTPVDLYPSFDHTAKRTYTIPAGTRVLVKKGRKKKFRYIIYESYTGFALNPRFANYHKFNSTLDGTLYGYSTIKTRYSGSTSGSGGPVQVRGYYRKNGTYVKPHTRKAPTRRN